MRSDSLIVGIDALPAERVRSRSGRSRRGRRPAVPASRGRPSVEHVTDHDEVVAAVVLRSRCRSRSRPARRARIGSRARAGRHPMPRELVVALAGEQAADVLLVLGEDVDAEAPGRLDLRPGRRRLRRAEERPAAGRATRERERVHRQADRLAVVHRRDHRDAGGEVAEHLAEPGRVERRGASRRRVGASAAGPSASSA